jgi:hypothetical protein
MARSHVVVRAALILAGTMSLLAGIAGIFIPLLPTTPFLLLAAACYAGSSPRLSKWLLGNRWFGSYIRNYREGRGMSMNAKAVSIFTLWLAIGYSAAFVMQATAGKIALLLIAAGVTAHILTRPTYRQAAELDAAHEKGSITR